jgi:hypothetical protein
MNIFPLKNALFPRSGSSRKLPGRFPEANVWNHEMEPSKIQSAYHWHRRWSTINCKTGVILQNSPEASRKLPGRFPEVKPSSVAHGPKRRRGGRSSQLCGSFPPQVEILSTWLASLSSFSVPCPVLLFYIDNYNGFFIKALHYFWYHNHGFLQPYYINIILLLCHFVISAAPEVPGSFPEERRKWVIYFRPMNRLAKE